MLVASLSVLCHSCCGSSRDEPWLCPQTPNSLVPCLSGVLPWAGVGVKPSGAVPGQEGTCVSAAVGARAGL